MEDRRILDLYLERSETAITETANKYGRYCHYIAFQILENDADVEEVVNDTYLKIWNTVPPQRPDSLKSYVGMLTRQLALDAYKRQNAQKRNGQASLALEELSECITTPGGNMDMDERIALRDALNSFLWTLPQRTRIVFMRRYFYFSTIAEIARDCKMKESNVTMLLLRTRKKLAHFLEKEGFWV